MFCHVPSNYLPQLMERSMMNCLGGFVVHGCGITCSLVVFQQTSTNQAVCTHATTASVLVAVSRAHTSTGSAINAGSAIS